MFSGSKNKKWLVAILGIVVCLAIVGPAGAGWKVQDKPFASDGAANDEFGW